MPTLGWIIPGDIELEPEEGGIWETWGPQQAIMPENPHYERALFSRGSNLSQFYLWNISRPQREVGNLTAKALLIPPPTPLESRAANPGLGNTLRFEG